MTRHTFIAWAFSEGANLKRLAEYFGTSVRMIEQSYGRYIRKDFLGLLMVAGPKTLGKAAVGEKPGPPLGGLGKRPGFPREFWWRRGELKTRHKESPVRKGRFGGGFSDLRVRQNTGIYCLLSLGDSGVAWLYRVDSIHAR
jgi:hypothetical protein